MIEMNPVAAATAARTAPAARTDTRPGGFTEGADFKMFLRMLTTQMQNQNPLDPTEASDFAVQLATFSGVEQQTMTNHLLGRLAEYMALGDLTGWLGREVATDGPVRHDGQGLSLYAAPTPGATRRDLVVTDTREAELMRIAVAPDRTRLSISAQELQGLLPGADYHLSVEDYRGTEKLSSTAARQYHLVQEVHNNAGQIDLVLDNGSKVPASQVTGIRAGTGAEP
ncbi:MAG: hypothetical protein JJT99_06765 [Rhodobacteraceae bacterium]|nr:hypothetical protein [Paracoccaceae bacterium]